MALLVSFASALFAGLSVFYSRRLANNDSKRLKRKALILEIELSPSKEYPEWQAGLATIRNIEPVSARIECLRSKTKHVQLLPQSASVEESGEPWNPQSKTQLDPASAKNDLDLEMKIEPVGYTSSQQNAGPTQYIRFFASARAVPKDFTIQWSWTDGTPL